MTDLPLSGLTVLIPETREQDLFAAMLEAQGARTLRCPLVQIAPAHDRTEADHWIDALIAGEFTHVVLLTGEGLKHLLAFCGTAERRACFITALGQTRIVTRGPKPVRALREIGLTPGLMAPQPTSEGVLAALEADGIAGSRIGLQLYPAETAPELTAQLRDRGATVTTVTPYRYAPLTDASRVAENIALMAEGKIDLITFTSTPQLDRLYAVAAERGIEAALHAALTRTRIAVIGPVVEASAIARGLAPSIRPESNFHLKPFVRAIVEATAKPQA